MKANWKLIIENFMECYHCATIHPELTEVLPEFADGYAAQYFVGHGAEFGEDVAGFTVDGTEGLDRIPGVAAEQDRRYYAITVKPQVFINLVPDHVIFHRMYPVAADRTIVECDWLYLPEVVAAGKDLSRSVELFHRVNGRTSTPAERCQPAMQLPRVRQGRRAGAQRAPHRAVPRVGQLAPRRGRRTDPPSTRNAPEPARTRPTTTTNGTSR